MLRRNWRSCLVFAVDLRDSPLAMDDLQSYTHSSDPEVGPALAAMSEGALHVLMCDCAEHAYAVSAPLRAAAGYRGLPSLSPVDTKREWLLGEVEDDALMHAQREAVWGCYWGNPLYLGATILGAAWCPGATHILQEDEQYAESMMDYDSALEAAEDVLAEALKAVADIHYRAQYRIDPESAGDAHTAALGAEIEWQRDRILKGPALREGEDE